MEVSAEAEVVEAAGVAVDLAVSAEAALEAAEPQAVGDPKWTLYSNW